jgi:hypothetical protein
MLNLLLLDLESAPSLVRHVTLAKILSLKTVQNMSVYCHRIVRRPREYLLHYKQFVQSLSKTFFKKLFLRDSQLGYRLQKITKQNRVLKGLKDQEYKHGTCTMRPLIPYIPVVDKVQDAVNANSNKPCTQKIKLSNKTKFQAGFFYTGTLEEFPMHMKQAIHTCDRMGLFLKYKTAQGLI